MVNAVMYKNRTKSIGQKFFLIDHGHKAMLIAEIA